LVVAPAGAKDADLSMRIFNADGSEAEMCGNGVRCVARYRYEQERSGSRCLAIATQAGVVRTEVVRTKPRFEVRVNMGLPASVVVHDRPGTIEGTRAELVDVSMGNPHCVAFVDGDLQSIDLPKFATEIAREGSFSEGVNVELGRVSTSAVAMRVHERGVGETWACGTGACAVAVAAIVTGRSVSPVEVSMRGGDVTVEWAGRGSPAFLTGGAEITFRTEVEVADEMLAQTSSPATLG
jgi:diaminopimelate epimerase